MMFRAQNETGARPAKVDALAENTAENLAEDLKALRSLPHLVQEAGYCEVYLLYGLMHLRRDALAHELAATPPALRALIELFGLGGAVAPDRLAPVLPSAVLRSLLRLGLLLESPSGLHCGELTLLPFWGRMAFVPTPRRNPMAFFGDDVVGLLARLGPCAKERALNLSAGPGLAALRLADFGTQVIAVEDHDLARACIELNAVMNGLEHRISVFDRVTWAEKHRNQTYDQVVANLAPMPFPQAFFLPARAAAQKTQTGNLSPTEQFLVSLPQLLAETGSAQVSGAGLGDANGPAAIDFLDNMARQHRLNLVLTICCHTVLHADSPLLEKLAWACHSVTGQSIENTRDRLELHLGQLGHRHLYLFYIFASKRGETAGLSVCRHDSLGKGFWFR